jgi:hypothetical protein
MSDDSSTYATEIRCQIGRFDGEVNASISAGCHSDHLSMSHSSSSDVVETLLLSILETAKSTRVSLWIARRFFVDV